MVEYVGIPYIEVMKHAFPACHHLLYRVALYRAPGGPQSQYGGPATARYGLGWLAPALAGAHGLGFCVVRGGVLGRGLGQDVAGSAAIWIIGAALLAAYVGLLWFGSRQPELPLDDPDAQVFELPETGPTVKSGLHYLLAVVVLIWCLMVEQMSPGLSAFWATLFIIL